jgi:sRNA-binding protein
MKRPLRLTALLIIALSLAACGGGEAQHAERAAPSQEKQTASAAQRVAKESASQESASQESASQESASQESAPEERVPRESAQGGEGREAAGISVTTLDGEQANLGGQGDVTALYFMAGW